MGSLTSTLDATRPGRIHFEVQRNHLVWDARSLEIFGLSREEFSGTYEGWARRVHEDDLPRIQALVDEKLPGGDHLSLRYRIRRPNGEIRHVWAVATVELDERGSPSLITGLHFDETEVRRLEGEFNLQREVLNSVTEGVCACREACGTIVYANPGMARILGYAGQALAGRRLGELVAPGSRPTAERARDAMSEPGNWMGEIEFRRADGHAVWTSTTITSLDHAEHGRLWIFVMSRLGQPRRREGALPEAEQRLTGIYDAIADAVFAVKMPDRKIEYANRAVTEMFGYSSRETIGATTQMLYANPDDYAEFGNQLREAFLNGARQVHAEKELRAKGGRLLWTSILTTFVTEDGQLSKVISVVRDISKQKEIERRLLQSQKMEAIGALAGGLAHDMNNVLAAVLMLSDLLRDGLEPGSPQRADVEQIMSAAQRGKSLVESLLGFARKGASPLRRVSMDEEIASAARLLERSVSKGISFHLDLAAPGTCVQGDGALLSQTVINLCLNARDAIGAAGNIRLRSRCAQISEGVTGDLRPGEYYVLSVSDDGHGMSGDVMRRAFEPFFTTKKVGQGSGLGLSMAYSVMQNHGGSILLDSELGSGTTVTCYLPVASGGAATKPGETLATNPGPLRVLLVDDEELVLATTRRALERLGHRVICANGGALALQRFEESLGRIDLVLLDLSMPDMSGAECLQRLRQLDPLVRVVICTGHSEETASVAVQSGTVVLRKPFTLSRLQNVVSEIVGSSAPFIPNPPDPVARGNARTRREREAP